jgi:hypothetical protein
MDSGLAQYFYSPISYTRLLKRTHMFIYVSIGWYPARLDWQSADNKISVVRSSNTSSEQDLEMFLYFWEGAKNNCRAVHK